MYTLLVVESPCFTNVLVDIEALVALANERPWRLETALLETLYDARQDDVGTIAVWFGSDAYGLTELATKSRYWHALRILAGEDVSQYSGPGSRRPRGHGYGQHYARASRDAITREDGVRAGAFPMMAHVSCCEACGRWLFLPLGSRGRPRRSCNARCAASIRRERNAAQMARRRRAAGRRPRGDLTAEEIDGTEWVAQLPPPYDPPRR